MHVFVWLLPFYFNVPTLFELFFSPLVRVSENNLSYDIGVHGSCNYQRWYNFGFARADRMKRADEGATKHFNRPPQTEQTSHGLISCADTLSGAWNDSLNREKWHYVGNFPNYSPTWPLWQKGASRADSLLSFRQKHEITPLLRLFGGLKHPHARVDARPASPANYRDEIGQCGVIRFWVKQRDYSAKAAGYQL